MHTDMPVTRYFVNKLIMWSIFEQYNEEYHVYRLFNNFSLSIGQQLKKNTKALDFLLLNLLISQFYFTTFH